MKLRKPVSALGAVALLAGAALASAPAASANDTTAAYTGDSAFALEIATEINDFRGSLGLSPLILDPSLTLVAQNWTNMMAEAAIASDLNTALEHNPTFFTEYPQDGLAAGSENILYNWGDDAETTVQQWIDSPGHYANMTKEGDTHFGVGFIKFTSGDLAGYQMATTNFGAYSAGSLISEGQIIPQTPVDENESAVPPVDETDPVVPPVDETDPVVPPVDETDPVVPPVDVDPVVPPVDETDPVVPPVDVDPVVPPVDETDPVVPPVDETDPVVPPVDETDPVVPPVDETDPVVPPVDETDPVVPPVDVDPVVPPVDETDPVVPPVDVDPVVPPVDETDPVVPPVDVDPVVPPVDETDPVVPPVDVDPVVPPVDETDPVVPPVDETDPVVPPVDETDPVNPPDAGIDPVDPPVVTDPVTPPVDGEEPVVPPVDETPTDEDDRPTAVDFTDKGLMTDDNHGGFATTTDGDNLTITGLLANHAYRVVLHSTPMDLGTMSTDANGVLVIAMPDALEAGMHRVALFDGDNLVGWEHFNVAADGVIDSVTVDEDAPPAGPAAPGAADVSDLNITGSISSDGVQASDRKELGETGFGDNAKIGLLGSLLVALGFGATAAARRGRHAKA